MEPSKAYDPKETEAKIYELWTKSGYFNPDKLPKRHKKPYTIVMPPPNVTGELHMGHALNATVQDILIRWKRLQGFKTLWLPGTDHAGIATQNVVEKKLKKENTTRFDLGREKFIEEVWRWKEKYGEAILGQLKRMGSSCDWSRTRFTMDEKYSLAVKEVFARYLKKGWIYQGERVVNWCPRCYTSLSDLELEYQEEKGTLWYIKYGAITVATTRPETMLGDTAVAVNPNDERYKDLIGKKVTLPIANREIPVVADNAIDPNFGAGALKVTPAHSSIDYEIGLRHNLASIKVIDERGRMTKEAPQGYQGLKALEAREKILGELKDKGLVEKEEEYIHQIPKCYRCSSVIEPIPSKQWFVKMDELKKMAADPVKKGEIKFHPKSYQKPYLDWLKNMKDWCISRQIWWGHTVPMEGEKDVLDTWFSSALWPFATLGFPEKTKDSKTFYPTDTLSTARDIINLWVSRMIFSGMEFMGKIPFKDVYIHATVLNKEGKRMSKSLGTGIDPIKLVEVYGADAVRFGLAYQVMGGQDIKFSEDNILMAKKFCNKIWNAARFVQGQTGNKEFNIPSSAKTLVGKKKVTAADKKILKQLEKIITSTNKSLENFEFGKASHDLYDFFWHDFCDTYIEASKKQKGETPKIILFVLVNSLILLHPFVPFVTEEIYQGLPLKNKKKCLLIEEWPS